MRHRNNRSRNQRSTRTSIRHFVLSKTERKLVAEKERNIKCSFPFFGLWRNGFGL
jgi:hypothetical protein